MRVSVIAGAIFALGFGGQAFGVEMKPDASVADRAATVAEICDSVMNFSGSGKDCARAIVKVIKENASGPRLIQVACSQFDGVNVRSACLRKGAKLTNRKSLAKGEEKCGEIKVAGALTGNPTPGYKKRIECMEDLLEAEPDFNQKTVSNGDPICSAPKVSKRNAAEQSEGDQEGQDSGGAASAF